MELATLNGVESDFDGKFEITVRDESSSLRISFVGYFEKILKVGAEREFNVILKENVSQLEEVVIIGYQAVKKSDVTGAVSKIKTEDLSEIPSNSVEELLVGRVSGLVIGNPSDDPGAGLNVRIRGASSFTATSPLIVVDGFPLGTAGNLKQINPADIVSVEVLKDASAASIYGSRGANGVILVTTRRGKEGKPTIQVTANTSFNTFASEFDIYKNPSNLAVLTDEGRINGGLTPLYIGANDINGVYYPSIAEIRNGYPTTTYIDYVFRTPINSNYNISAHGGTDKTKYNFGLNYNTQNGVVRNNDLEKITVSFGLEQELVEKLKLSTNLNFSRGNRNDNGGISFNRNIFFPLYNEDGSFFKFNENDFFNPAALTELRINNSETLDLISSSILQWQITNDLKFKSQFNYSLGSSIQERYFPKVYTQLGNEGNGVGFIDNFQSQRVVADAYFTYNKLLAEKHDVTLVAGYSSEYFEEKTSQLRGQDFVNEILGAGNLSLGKEQRVSNNFRSTVLSSVFTRLNYAFDDRFLLTFTSRLDGSSNFGKNNRFAYFPSGALSWKMQNEEFMEDSREIVNELKPRVSYGVVGNQAIAAFQTLNRLGEARYFVDGGFVTTIGPGVPVNEGIFTVFNGIGNPDLKWETTTVLNAGLDFAGFKRRLSFNFDYYIKKTEDLLVQSNLPPTAGFDTILINGGEIENKGFEASINYDIIKKVDFNVSAGLIFNRNRNQVISLGPAGKVSVLSDDFGNQFDFRGVNYRDQFRSRINASVIGQPLNVFYGARVIGIVQSEAEGLAAGLEGAAAQPGEFLYEDLNKDGVLDPFGKDRTIIGDPNPDFTASFTLDVSYKNWDLSALFNGSFGGDVVNINRFAASNGGGQVSSLLQRWTPDNRTELYPSLRDNRNVAFSDWWIEDGSFVRLQNLRIGYNFTNEDIKYFKNARIYFSGDNLFSLTNYSGVDPEVDVAGVDLNRVPRLRRMTLGLEFTF